MDDYSSPRSNLFDTGGGIFLSRVGLVEHSLFLLIMNGDGKRIIQSSDYITGTGCASIDRSMRKITLVGEGVSTKVRQTGFGCCFVLEAIQWQWAHADIANQTIASAILTRLDLDKQSLHSRMPLKSPVPVFASDRIYTKSTL